MRLCKVAPFRFLCIFCVFVRSWAVCAATMAKELTCAFISAKDLDTACMQHPLWIHSPSCVTEGCSGILIIIIAVLGAKWQNDLHQLECTRNMWVIIPGKFRAKEDMGSSHPHKLEREEQAPKLFDQKTCWKPFDPTAIRGSFGTCLVEARENDPRNGAFLGSFFWPCSRLTDPRV